MSTLVFLVPLALLLGAAALGAFFWSLRSGQYDDLDGASQRIFIDDAADRADAHHGASKVPGCVDSAPSEITRQ